jgi:signal peptidase II
MLAGASVFGAGDFAPAMGSVVLVDQALKAALLRVLPDGRALRVGSLIRIRPLRSSGTFASRIGVPRALQALLLVAALFVLWNSGLLGSNLAGIALGVAAGGAASNLLDHALRGGVVDYVDLRVWPAFNLADAAIVVGVILTLVAMIAGGIG